MTPLNHGGLVLALAVAISVASCASTPPESTSESEAWKSVDLGELTYHDDNADGIVDLEMHDYGCCDRNWALVDSDFDGTFDLRVRWGYSLTTEPIEQPVPHFVAISPQSSGWVRLATASGR